MSSFISIFFSRGFVCPWVWSRAQQIARKIAIEDPKSINFILHIAFLLGTPWNWHLKYLRERLSIMPACFPYFWIPYPPVSVLWAQTKTPTPYNLPTEYLEGWRPSQYKKSSRLKKVVQKLLDLDIFWMQKKNETRLGLQCQTPVWKDLGFSPNKFTLQKDFLFRKFWTKNKYKF